MLRKVVAACAAVMLALPVAFVSVEAAHAAGNEITLDISEGAIDIMSKGYDQGDTALTNDYDWKTGTVPTEYQPFSGTYIITGASYGLDTPLEIMNFSGSPVEYNLVFDNLTIQSYEWATAIRFKGNAPMTVNILNKGTTSLAAGNHAVFKIPGDTTNYQKVYVNVYNTLGSTIGFWTQQPSAEVIYDSDEVEGLVVFKINDATVGDGTDGTIDNTEMFSSSHTHHTFTVAPSSDESGGEATVNATWPSVSPDMTESEFRENGKDMACTFACTECGTSFAVDPEVVSVSEDGLTGTYKAVLPASEARQRMGLM